MNRDEELNAWCADWRSEADLLNQQERQILQDLPCRVERESARIRIMLVVKIALTVVFLGTISTLTIRQPSAHMVGLLMAVMLFFSAGWAISWDTWRGTQLSSCEDTLGFLDLSIRRCRASLRAMNAALLFTACELIFVGVWAAPPNIEPKQGGLVQFFLSPTMIVIVLTALSVFAYLGRRKSRLRIELKSLLLLKKEDLDADNSVAQHRMPSMKTGRRRMFHPN